MTALSVWGLESFTFTMGHCGIRTGRITRPMPTCVENHGYAAQERACIRAEPWDLGLL